MRRYDNEINNSNTSEENMTRTYNEYVDIRRHFFDEMSDVVLKKHLENILKIIMLNQEKNWNVKSIFIV